MTKAIFRSKDATELLRYAEQIFKKMTENVDMFTNPVPDLTTLETNLTRYRDAYAEATFRDKRAVILKGQKGKDLQRTIYQLARYIDGVAEGDAAIIVAAGFRPSGSTTNSIGKTPKAENLRVEHLQVGTGVVQLRVNAWKSARLYQYEYRKKGSESWTAILHTRSSVELRDLEMMQEYEFRVSYVGTDTVMNYSDIVTALVV